MIEKYRTQCAAAAKSCYRDAYCCWLAIVSPTKFGQEEQEEFSNSNSTSPAGSIDRIQLVRRALFYSLLLVAFSGILGVAIGYCLARAVGSAGPPTVTALQIIGSLILLWATLAVRGWDVQTFNGTSLTERVNQMLYRVFCFIGTTILVVSVAW